MQTRYSLVLAALFALPACQAKPEAATETVGIDPEPDKPAAAPLVPEKPAVIEQTADLTAAASSDAPQPKAVVDPAPSKPSAAEVKVASAEVKVASAEIKVASAPAADAVTSKPQPSPKLPARAEKAIAPAQPKCPSLAKAGLASGTYVSQGRTAMKLTLVDGCSEPSVLSNAKGEVLAKSVLEERPIGSRSLLALGAAEGDVCQDYVLRPGKSGSLSLRWYPDPTASAHRKPEVARACKSTQGTFVPLVEPSAAPAPAPEVKGKSCDVKQVDWKNFDFGGLKLQNGTEASGGAEYNEGHMSKLSEVHYADLDGDRALEALVLVECPHCGPGMSSFGSLHGYKLDASCAPQSVGVLDANGYGGGKISGRKFIFERNETTMSGPDGPSMESWRVECVMRGGKLVEKVTPL